MKQIMRWPPWPPLFAVKFDVIVVVHKMEGLLDSDGDGDNDHQSQRGGVTRKRPVVEIKWKGPKSVTLKRSVVRNFTEEGGFRGDGVVEWNEEFKRVCEFSVYKEGEFLPWLVSFTVFNVSLSLSLFLSYLLLKFLTFILTLMSYMNMIKGLCKDCTFAYVLCDVKIVDFDSYLRFYGSTYNFDLAIFV